MTEIAEYVGREARPSFLERLGPEVRALVSEAPRGREAWAPLSFFVDALEAADSVVGRGDLGSCWDIGRFTATHETGAVRTFALGLLRPSTLLSLAASIWTVHYRDAGRATVRAVGPRSVQLSIIDFPSPHPAHCRAVGGWAEGALGLGRRTSIRVVKTACRCDGAPTCDFLVAWEEI